MIDKSQYSLTVSSNKNNKFTNLNIKEKKTNIPLPLLFLLDQKKHYSLYFTFLIQTCYHNHPSKNCTEKKRVQQKTLNIYINKMHQCIKTNKYHISITVWYFIVLYGVTERFLLTLTVHVPCCPVEGGV